MHYLMLEVTVTMYLIWLQDSIELQPWKENDAFHMQNEPFILEHSIN